MAPSVSPRRSRPPPSQVRVYVLGRFQVEVDGEPLSLPARGRRKSLELLKLLVAYGGQQSSVSEITESLWPDSDGDLAYRTFSTTLHRLRELIGHDALALQGGRLSLVLEHCWVDALAFSAALSGAERALAAGDAAAAATQAEAALALYRGPFLPGEFDLAEALSARQRLHGAFLRVIGELGAVYTGEGALDRAIPLYQKGLEVDPLAEELYQRLMDCFRQQGRLVEAIAVYQRCKELFKSSVDSEPSGLTTAAYEAIVAQQRQRTAAASSLPSPEPERPAPRAPAPTLAVPVDAGTKSAQGQIATEGERRRATVVFSDLVGYTQLNETLDPEDVRIVLDRIKAEAVKIVERHEGIVNQFVGDQVVSLFGIPTAHEDDPLRAVEAALEMQDMVRRISVELEPKLGQALSLHTGINTGLIVTSARDAREGTYGLTGSALTIGARLTSMAQANEILVSPETHRLVAPFFLTQPLDLTFVKGKDTPLVPHRIVGKTQIKTRFEAARQRGLTPFFGRDQELANLKSLLEKAIASQGQFVTVEGEAGMGKSRLLHEFLRDMDRDRITIVHGRCDSQGKNTPYLPIINALRQGLGLGDEDAPEAVLQKTVAALRGIHPELAQFLPTFLDLLSIQSPERQLPQGLPSEQERKAIELALATLMTFTVQRKPLVLLLEDWHWVDDATELVMRNLLGTIAHFPLLVTITYRPEYRASWVRQLHHTHIGLDSIEVHHTERIIKAILGADALPEGLADLIQARTEGNPFFVEETCRALVEVGCLPVIEGKARLSQPMDGLALPDSLQAVIRARLDRLDADARRSLGLASIIGEEFPLRLLERVAAAQTDLVRSLDILVDHGQIHKLRIYPDVVYRFNHATTQRVVYDTLLVEQRARLHERVAHAIEELYPERIEEQCEALAYHYSRSMNVQKAVLYLESAGDKAAHYFSLTEARLHYRAAVSRLQGPGLVAEDPTRRIDLTFKWSGVSFYDPSPALLNALESAIAAARSLQDEVRLARATCWAGMMHYALGNQLQARSRLEACMEMAQVARDAEMHALTSNYLGRVCFYLAEFDRAKTYLEAGIPLLQGLGRHDEAANSLAMLATVHGFCGEFPRGSNLSEEAMRIAERIDNPTTRSASGISQCVIALMRGDWAEAARVSDEVRNISRSIGNSIMQGLAVWVKGYATAMLGGPAEGLPLMDEGIGLIEIPDSRLGLGACCGRLALSYALSGRCDKAGALSEKALALVAAGGDRLGEHMAYAAMAIVASRVAPPNWESVAEAMSKALRLARERGMRPDLATLELQYARLLHRQGDSAGSREHLSQARRTFSELGMDWWTKQADDLAA